MNTENLNLQDKYLTCEDCGELFLFEKGEQAFYIRKRLNLPKRCPACRTLRKLDYSPNVKLGGE